MTTPASSPAARSIFTQNVWSDLVIAILSVNNYPVEKTYSHARALEEFGLFDPDKLASLDQAKIAQALVKAGYSRGPFMTELFSARLVALGQFIASYGQSRCATVLRDGSRQAVSSLLSEVKGIGPTVLRNYFALHGRL